MNIVHLSEHRNLLPELAELHFAEWGHLRLGDSVAFRQERLASAVGNPGSVPSSLVAIDAGELCGSAMLLASDMGRGDLSPWFAGLYVKPKFRSRGIARTLMQHILREARQAGATTIYLCAELDKRAFYAGRGWSSYEDCDWHGRHIVVMSRAVG